MLPRASALFTLSLAALAASVVGCLGSERLEDAPGEGAPAALTPAVKTPEVKALDAMVDEISGYRSIDDYVTVQPSRFKAALVGDVEAKTHCEATGRSEGGLRATIRDRASNALRMFELTWSSQRGDVFVERHETYHYDETGSLRVVVLDTEEDHMLDDAFAAEVFAHNERVKQELDAMVPGDEASRVAIANKGRELRDTTRIIQHRIYFRANGSRLYETTKAGLEQARAVDFLGIPQTPPSLYGTQHPANVLGRPVFERLFPEPSFRFEAFPELEVPAGQSLVAALAARDPLEPEAAVAAPMHCP